MEPNPPPKIPEGATFLHFSSWFLRTHPGPVAERLQLVTAKLDSGRTEPDTWFLSRDADALILRWDDGTTATVTADKIIWNVAGEAQPDLGDKIPGPAMDRLVKRKRERQVERHAALKDDPFKERKKDRG